MSNAHLYCLEAVDGAIAKVGTTFRLLDRIGELRAVAPFDLRFRHVIRFEDRHLANAWEKHILCNARRYRDRGEWVFADEKLDSLFRAIPDGLVCTSEFQFSEKTGRRIPKMEAANTQSDILKARLKAKVGPALAARSAFDGSQSDYDRAVIRARMADGYGAEDIAVMDGIDVATVRLVMGLPPLRAAS